MPGTSYFSQIQSSDGSVLELAAAKLQTARGIDGVGFDGSAGIIHYAECSTAADTAAKTANVVDAQGNNYPFNLATGSVVYVKFINSNTASSPTLNINGTGAKSIKRYGTTSPSTTAYSSWNAGSVVCLVYDGTYWQMTGWINTTYSNAYLGQGYGTCDTAEATTQKNVTLSSYQLIIGGIVVVKFTDAVPANATMNVNSKGAKAIYHRGAAITAGVIKAGDTATFVYSTYYHLVSIDRAERVFTAGSDDTPPVPGNNGLVPAPAFNEQGKFLRGDGTWQTVLNDDSGFLHKAGEETITGEKTILADLILRNTTGSSNLGAVTPKIIFQRGTSSDGYIDWVIYSDSSGRLVVASRASGVTTTMLKMTASSGGQKVLSNINVEAPRFVKTGGTASQYLKANGDVGGDMVGATSQEAGAQGLVPQPQAGDEGKVLFGSGSWVAPPPLLNLVFSTSFPWPMNTSATSNANNYDITNFNNAPYIEITAELLLTNSVDKERTALFALELCTFEYSSNNNMTNVTVENSLSATFIHINAASPTSGVKHGCACISAVIRGTRNGNHCIRVRWKATDGNGNLTPVLGIENDEDNQSYFPVSNLHIRVWSPVSWQ